MINYDIPQLASTCNHREIRVSPNKTFCKKCGRVRLILEQEHVFFYCNGVQYTTKYLKGVSA